MEPRLRRALAFKLPESDALKQEVQSLRLRIEEIEEQLSAFEVPQVEPEEAGKTEKRLVKLGRKWWKPVEISAENRGKVYRFDAIWGHLGLFFWLEK